VVNNQASSFEVGFDDSEVVPSAAHPMSTLPRCLLSLVRRQRVDKNHCWAPEVGLLKPFFAGTGAEATAVARGGAFFANILGASTSSAGIGALRVVDAAWSTACTKVRP
jgi:hypothetical protein